MKNDALGPLIAGGIFLLVGLPFAWIGWSIGQQADRLEQLPIFNLATLERNLAGTEGVIQGTIAERNPLQFRTFVAYIREQYQGEDCDDDGCDPIWREQERVAPPLWLDLPSGRARVINSNYDLASTTAAWISTEEWVAYETLRYQGFEIDDTVFAVGRVAPADGGPALEADSLYGGNRDDRVASDRLGSRIFLGLGSLISLIGGGLLGWLVLKVVR